MLVNKLLALSLIPLINALSTLNHAEIARYSRHLVLGSVGVAGQEKLKEAKVLLIGAGGLGSPAGLYLAAAGIGTIGVVDADTVDESNLQRQIIHGTSTLNKPKVQSAAERIKDLNPFVNVVSFEEEFTSKSAIRILQAESWDVVLDGSDNFPTKYLINDACEIMNIPWVYSAILAFEGQLSVFNYKNGPTYRDLLPEPPNPGDVPSCAEGGVLGVLPGTMGCMQATEVIKLLLDDLDQFEGKVCSGRVLCYDALQMKFNDIHLEKDSTRSTITELIDYQGFCAGPKTSSAAATPSSNDGSKQLQQSANDKNKRTMDETLEIDESIDNNTNLLQSIEPEVCLQKLMDGWTPWVLDCRLESEHNIVAIPFTDKVVPHREVARKHIPKSGDVLLYCKGGVRSKKAIQNLLTQGVDPSRLYNLEGGIMKWQKVIDPSMPRY